jgi:hypothetical protein
MRSVARATRRVEEFLLGKPLLPSGVRGVNGIPVEVHLNNNEDVFRWNLHQHGQFYVQLIYLAPITTLGCFNGEIQCASRNIFLCGTCLKG